MKKLMIAAAVMCAAALAQAGYVAWSCSNVKDGEGTGLATGHIYAFFYETAAAANTQIGKFTADGMTESTFTSLVDDANWNDSKKATGAGSFNVNTATAAGGYSKDALANSVFGLKDSTSYSAFLVITDTDGITDATKFIVTAPVVKSTAGSSVTVASFSFGSQSGATWYAVSAGATPEPTSALLMLFGLGAMALRRRRV